MEACLKLSASEILAINVPELLFSGDLSKAKIEYRKLASKWHTDINSTCDSNVIAHINVLYDQAKFKLETGDWEIPGQILFKTTKGKSFQFKYRAKRAIDVGDMYIGDSFVIFSVTKANADLYANGSRIIKNFKFADDKMKQEISRFLPTIHSEIETEDRMVMVLKKTPDVLCLRDVLDHFKGKVEPRHVAWIVSRIYNLTCYLKYAGIVHSGISLDSYFISPEFHSGILLGDWWYATNVGSKLTAIPGLTATFVKSDIFKSKKSTHQIDLELCRVVGRALLGDPIGSKLLMDKSIPKALITWLRSPPGDDAFEEYKIWQSKVLIDSFGVRKFVELKLTANDLYGK